MFFVVVLFLFLFSKLQTPQNSTEILPVCLCDVRALHWPDCVPHLFLVRTEGELNDPPSVMSNTSFSKAATFTIIGIQTIYEERFKQMVGTKRKRCTDKPTNNRVSPFCSVPPPPPSFSPIDFIIIHYVLISLREFSTVGHRAESRSIPSDHGLYK